MWLFCPERILMLTECRMRWMPARRKPDRLPAEAAVCRMTMIRMDWWVWRIPALKNPATLKGWAAHLERSPTAMRMECRMRVTAARMKAALWIGMAVRSVPGR